MLAATQKDSTLETFKRAVFDHFHGSVYSNDFMALLASLERLCRPEDEMCLLGARVSYVLRTGLTARHDGGEVVHESIGDACVRGIMHGEACPHFQVKTSRVGI